MLILNFNRPFTSEQYTYLQQRFGSITVHEVPARYKPGRPLAETVQHIADEAAELAGLRPHSWQTERIVINPPGFAPLAVALVAEIHGRRGNFPLMILMCVNHEVAESTYEIVEITNLQKIRDTAYRH